MQAEPKRAAAKRVTQPALPATTATATLTATATHAWQPRLRNPRPTWSLTRSQSRSWSQSCSLSSSLTSSLRTAYVSAVLHLPLVRCTLHVIRCTLQAARCSLPVANFILHFQFRGISFVSGSSSSGSSGWAVSLPLVPPSICSTFLADVDATCDCSISAFLLRTVR